MLISNNHSELPEKIDAADKDVKEALELVKNNEIVTRELNNTDTVNVLHFSVVAVFDHFR